MQDVAKYVSAEGYAFSVIC